MLSGFFCSPDLLLFSIFGVCLSFFLIAFFTVFFAISPFSNFWAFLFPFFASLLSGVDFCLPRIFALIYLCYRSLLFFLCYFCIDGFLVLLSFPFSLLLFFFLF